MTGSTPTSRYWRANLQILFAMLAIWCSVSFGCGILFVEQLNQYHFGGFPLGFWFAQQGSIYTFVVLILIYAILMDRLDKKFSQARSKEEGAQS